MVDEVRIMPAMSKSLIALMLLITLQLLLVPVLIILGFAFKNAALPLSGLGIILVLTPPTFYLRKRCRPEQKYRIKLLDAGYKYKSEVRASHPT